MQHFGLLYRSRGLNVARNAIECRTKAIFFAYLVTSEMRNVNGIPVIWQSPRLASLATTYIFHYFFVPLFISVFWAICFLKHCDCFNVVFRLWISSFWWMYVCMYLYIYYAILWIPLRISLLLFCFCFVLFLLSLLFPRFNLFAIRWYLFFSFYLSRNIEPWTPNDQTGWFFFMSQTYTPRCIYIYICRDYS